MFVQFSRLVHARVGPPGLCRRHARCRAWAWGTQHRHTGSVPRCSEEDGTAQQDGNPNTTWIQCSKKTGICVPKVELDAFFIKDGTEDMWIWLKKLRISRKIGECHPTTTGTQNQSSTIDWLCYGVSCIICCCLRFSVGSCFTRCWSVTAARKC